jgi:hypothetical protein
MHEDPTWRGKAERLLRLLPEESAVRMIAEEMTRSTELRKFFTSPDGRALRRQVCKWAKACIRSARLIVWYKYPPQYLEKEETDALHRLEPVTEFEPTEGHAADCPISIEEGTSCASTPLTTHRLTRQTPRTLVQNPKQPRILDGPATEGYTVRGSTHEESQDPRDQDHPDAEHSYRKEYSQDGAADGQCHGHPIRTRSETPERPLLGRDGVHSYHPDVNKSLPASTETRTRPIT